MQSHNERNGRFNLGEFLDRCKARWKWFVISVAVFGCLGVIWVLRSQPQSEVIANVLISEDDGGGGGIALEIASSFNMGDMFGGSRSVDDELAVMTSHTVMRNTVKALQLNKACYKRENMLKTIRYYRDYPLEMSYNPTIPDTLSVPLKFKIHVDGDNSVSVESYISNKKYSKADGLILPAVVRLPYGEFTFNATDNFVPGEDFDGIVNLYSYDAAADAYAKEIEIFILNKKTDMISMSLLSTDPVYACTIVNTVINEYNRMGIKEKQSRDSITGRFIEQRLLSLSDELGAAEREVENFKREHDIVDVSVQAELLLSTASEQTAELLKAETEYDILGATRKFIADPANRYSLIPSIQSEDGGLSVIEPYNDLILKRMTMESSAKENNASLKMVTEQIDALRKNVIASVDKQYENAGIRLAQIKSQVNKSKSVLNEIPTQERQFIEIKRQQAIKEQLYMYLLKQREETAMSRSNARPRALIIDEAYISSEPVGLTAKKKLALVLLLGVVFPAIVIFVRERMGGKFYSKSDVAHVTDLPILGEVSVDHSGSHVVVGSGVSSLQTEQFRIIRSNLRLLLGENKKVALVTSVSHDEGKTFVAVNLAISLSLLGKRVLLIDMNIRDPKVGEYLGLPSREGLTRYLSDTGVNESEIICRYKSGGASVDVIQGGEDVSCPAELLESERLDLLMNSLRARYDYIIADTASLGGLSDTRQLDRLCDVTVCVIRADFTTQKELSFINEVADALTGMSIVVNGTMAPKPVNKKSRRKSFAK